MNKKLFITLQGKGGVSKSTTTIWLDQYFRSLGKTVHGFDTDPNNQSYAGFKALDVQPINIMDSKHSINPREFDNMMEAIVASEVDALLVDNGATSFNPIVQYFQEADIWSLLKDQNIDVVINTICCGGSEHTESLKGIKFLQDITDAPILIFMNSYFGEMPTGKYEPSSILTKALGDRLLGLVNVPNKSSQTFEKDIQDLHGSRLTFDEFLSDVSKKMMHKHRISTFRKELFAELDKVDFGFTQPAKANE